MATRRKRSGHEPPAEGSALSVVLEEVRGQSRVVGGQFAALRDQVTALGAKVDDGLARLDDRVTRLDENVTQGFARIEQDVGLLKIAVIDINRQLKSKVDRDEIEPIVERVLARAAGR